MGLSKPADVMKYADQLYGKGVNEFGGSVQQYYSELAKLVDKWLAPSMTCSAGPVVAVTDVRRCDARLCWTTARLAGALWYVPQLDFDALCREVGLDVANRVAQLTPDRRAPGPRRLLLFRNQILTADLDTRFVCLLDIVQRVRGLSVAYARNVMCKRDVRYELERLLETANVVANEGDERQSPILVLLHGACLDAASGLVTTTAERAAARTT